MSIGQSNLNFHFSFPSATLFRVWENSAQFRTIVYRTINTPLVEVSSIVQRTFETKSINLWPIVAWISIEIPEPPWFYPSEVNSKSHSSTDRTQCRLIYGRQCTRSASLFISLFVTKTLERVPRSLDIQRSRLLRNANYREIPRSFRTWKVQCKIWVDISWSVALRAYLVQKYCSILRPSGSHPATDSRTRWWK